MVSDFVAHFCMLRVSKNLWPCENHVSKNPWPCENCTRISHGRRFTQFSHGSRFFDTSNGQKCVTQIIYLGPLPSAQGSNQDRVAAGASEDCGMAADAATGQGGAWLRPLARGGKLQQTQCRENMAEFRLTNQVSQLTKKKLLGT